MTRQQRSMMEQIEATKKEAQQLREFLKDAARVATLTYPTTSNSAYVAPSQAPRKKP
ncbi:hypothetical protein [Roseateles sp.]|jgi:cystathionine beta-lyase/cystathionine gamma-synthase|uniref:hypothetical protein n=1 Tax=Roseateles sp. TaxID=1971397 RepID=UPI0031E242B2